MTEHPDPIADLDVSFDDGVEAVPAVEDEAAWSPVMSIPPPDEAAAVDLSPDLPEVPDEPPMPPIGEADLDTPPPPGGVGPIDLGEAPPLPEAGPDGLPPALPDAEVAEPPMPPVTGDPEPTAPPAPGTTDAGPAGDGPIDLGQPPLPPGAGATTDGTVDDLIDTGQPGAGEPEAPGAAPIDLGEPPMPPVTGDPEPAAPPAPGTTDAGPAGDGPIDLGQPPLPPGAGATTDGTVSDLIGTGQPGTDELGTAELESPATGEAATATSDGVFLSEDPTPTTDDVLDSLYIRIDPEHAPAVVGSLVDTLSTQFPSIDDEARTALRAALDEAASDGGITYEEQLGAMRHAGLVETTLGSGHGEIVTTAVDEASGRGDTVTTIVNVGDGADEFRLSVNGDGVQFESTRTSSGFTVDRATFARAFDAPGARLITAPLPAGSAEAAVPIDLTSVAKDAEAAGDGEGGDGPGSDFGRNLLIGGAILLPAAGAATWFATRKVR